MVKNEAKTLCSLVLGRGKGSLDTPSQYLGRGGPDPHLPPYPQGGGQDPPTTTSTPKGFSYILGWGGNPVEPGGNCRAGGTQGNAEQKSAENVQRVTNCVSSTFFLLL